MSGSVKHRRLVAVAVAGLQDPDAKAAFAAMAERQEKFQAAIREHRENGFVVDQDL